MGNCQTVFQSSYTILHSISHIQVFQMLHIFTSTLYYLQNFVKYFTASINMTMWFFLLKLLVWQVTLILNTEPSLQPWVNPTWCRCFTLFMHCWIQFDNILLRIFMPMFIKDFGLQFSCTVCSFLLFNIYSLQFKQDNFYLSISFVICILPSNTNGAYFECCNFLL